MSTKQIRRFLRVLFAVVLCQAITGYADPLGTAFTYQGRLIDANQPAEGLYDLQFKLYDAASVGNQAGSDVDSPDMQVTDGYFTVELDFGDNVFNGEARWLEIGVRPGVLSDPSAYTALAPWQKLAPAPYSLQTRGIRVDGNGYVGMGTLLPICSLDVVGRDNEIVLARINQKGLRAYSGYRLDRDGSEKWLVGMGNTDEKLIFRRTASVNDMVIDTSGNVGIGTTAPLSKLSVGGPGYSDVGVYGTTNSDFGSLGKVESGA